MASIEGPNFGEREDPYDDLFKNDKPRTDLLGFGDVLNTETDQYPYLADYPVNPWYPGGTSSEGSADKPNQS